MPINHKQRADDALTAFLASRSIREMPMHRDARTDLDGDGTQDVLMLLEDPNWCQAEGCTLLVFRSEKDLLQLIGQSVSVRRVLAAPSRRSASACPRSRRSQSSGPPRPIPIPR